MGLLDDEIHRRQVEQEAARRAQAAREAEEREAEDRRRTWTDEGRHLAEDFLRAAIDRGIEPSTTLYTVTLRREQYWTNSSSPMSSGLVERWSEREVGRAPFAKCYEVALFRICADTGALLNPTTELLSDEPATKGGWLRDDTPRTQTLVKSWERIPLTNAHIAGNDNDDFGPLRPSSSLAKEMASFLDRSARPSA